MPQINVKDIQTVEWKEGIPGRLGGVEILYRNGELKKYEGDELASVVPQIKDRFPSTRPDLLSEIT